MDQPHTLDPNLKAPQSQFDKAIRLLINDEKYKNNHNIIPTYFFQINFFKDHTKVILCPLMGAVTYIDEKRRSRTFRFDLIKEHGCSEDIATRLQYVLEKVESMLTSHKSTTSSSEYNVPTLAACRLVIFILATKGKKVDLSEY